ncbi:MAG: hypothetical protein NC122_10975 [Faecalibacterium sp.]|nr:hypothetical protein [Ruminococcus sp.]MCM1393237.1 hypothetical protein [Ruminococcus sp.]MCM1486712.1 hypothetical protein [Faecalibacterium sp.]
MTIFKLFSIICAVFVAVIALAAVNSFVGCNSYSSISIPNEFETEEQIEKAEQESVKYFPEYIISNNKYSLERESVKGATYISGLTSSHGATYEFEYIKTSSLLSYFKAFVVKDIQPFDFMSEEDMEKVILDEENIDGTDVSTYQLDDSYIFRINGFGDILFVTVRNTRHIDTDIDTIKKAAVKQFNTIRQNEKEHTFVGVAV